MPKKKLSKMEERVLLKERKYIEEQLMKNKRSEEWEVLEEVFDRPTIFRLYNFLNKGIISRIHGSIKAGKESKIFWGELPNGEEAAIKIYLTISSEFKKGMLNYIQGDPRFPKIKKSTRSFIYLWAKKEFKNLTLTYNAGIRVPKPITVSDNVLIMEFIGEKGIPAPLLRDMDNSKINFNEFYNRILAIVFNLYNKVELVHADLSEYNIMVWKDSPVLIDFSQSVHREHPSSDTFLKRDINNLNTFFSKHGVKTRNTDELIKCVMKS